MPNTFSFSGEIGTEFRIGGTYTSSTPYTSFILSGNEASNFTFLASPLQTIASTSSFTTPTGSYTSVTGVVSVVTGSTTIDTTIQSEY